MEVCTLIVISITLGQVSCPNLGLSYPAATPANPATIQYGKWNIKEDGLTYKADFFFKGKKVSRGIVGDYTICLETPEGNPCLHGWYHRETVTSRKKASAGCYRMLFEDIKELWQVTYSDTAVEIKP